MKPSKKTPDIVIGLIITSIFCISFYTKTGFLETIELKSYDMRMRLFHPAKASEEIAIVAIDDESIAKLGRWPWPRTRIAEGIKRISEAGAKVIGINIIFSEPEEASGLSAIETMEKKFSESGLVSAKGGGEFLGEIEKIKEELNRDEKLALSIEAGRNVVLPVAFDFGSGMRKTLDAEEIPVEVAKAAIQGGPVHAPIASRMIWPIPRLSRAAAASEI